MLIFVSLVILAVAGQPEAVDSAHAPSPGQVRHDQVSADVKAGRLLLYPPTARRDGVTGKVILDCAVDRDGWYSDCKIAQENPVGYGFGANALKMAPLFRAKPIANATPSDPGSSAALPRASVPVNFTGR
jgi:TonB family protein